LLKITKRSAYMPTRYIFFLIIFIQLTVLITAVRAEPVPSDGFAISGTVLDDSDGSAMPYVTISVLEQPDSTMVTGTVTNDEGMFTLKVKDPGQYWLQLSFMGYKKKTMAIELQPDEGDIDLGNIKLIPDADVLEEVTVTGNKFSMDYKIDKKVLHVSKQHTTISGTAVDALQYAPSVQVDIEGNVSLRGNTNFTVLIDGKPSVLDATEALEQIPASSVKDIEIITNPSAKYDPEGTAGIINIITKKRSLNGISGLVHLNTGLDDKYGGDILLNYQTNHLKFFVSGDFNHRTYPGSMEHDNRFYGGDTTYYVQSSGMRERQRERYSFRAGAEWFPDDNHTVSVSGRYGNRMSAGTYETEYTEWNSVDTNKNEYISTESGERGGHFFSLQSNYVYQIETDHKFDAEFMYYERDGSDNSINTLNNLNDVIQTGQKSLEYGPSKGMRYRLNYKQPFSGRLKLEAGLQGRFRDSKENNEIYYYDTARSEYVLQENFSHEVNYLRNIHAGYGLIRGEIGEGLGYQLGLRTEYTYRDIRLGEDEDNFLIDRWDFFPTTHFSYDLNENNQVMVSYTRRIDRPHGWYLEPFITWSDAYNVRQGNPALKPEYINAFEMAYQKEFGKHAFSTEIFYRITKNNIERIRTVYSENIMMHSYDNVGKDFSLGTEVMLNAEIVDWWNTDITGNLYDYRVKGEIDGVEYDNHSLTWNLRWNNSFQIAENTVIQLNPAYHGPEIEPQEEEAAYFDVDGAVRQSFFNKKLKVTLQVRDIFGTSKYESITETPELYNYRLYKHKTPIVMLNLSYSINNYKDKSSGGPVEGEVEGGEM
jgi:outer membrane receptor protein involved in Fe transport